MSDLISRKETYNELIESIDWLRERDYELYCVIGDSIRVCLDEQPTAYDVDKVVEELETNKQNALEVEESIKEYNVWNEAIEIVKQGGVSDASDNVCEWFKYDYRTICPKNHDTNNPYWRIPDNMDKLKYCPYCGKKIKEMESD